MIQVREYRDGDMAAIEDSVEMHGADSTMREIQNKGMFITLEDDGIPVATGGLVQKDVDTAEAWVKVDASLLSDGCLRDRIRLVRTLRTALNLVDECLGFPKMCSHVEDMFIKGERLVKVLGFKKTGLSKMYDNKAYNLYERSL